MHHIQPKRRARAWPMLLLTLTCAIGVAAITWLSLSFVSALTGAPGKPHSAPVRVGPIYLPLLAAPGPAGAYTQTFDGDPPQPQAWQPATWDVTVHSRNVGTWQQLEPMQAGHGANCSAPPESHQLTQYEDAVFLCKNHMMTAIKAEGYGVIYLTPNQLLDLSAGEAVVRWNMSTLRTSDRDWVDVWITPYEDNLQLPLESWLPDLQGEPRNAVHIRMNVTNGQTVFTGEVVRNFEVTDITTNNWTGYETRLGPDARRRDLFELRLSSTHVKFGMPEYNLWWIDTTIADLGWTVGVVQFGHHSYNPTKDCTGCAPNTWHWDNIELAPAMPFTMLRADRRSVDAASPVVRFGAPAPDGAHLRFAGIGNALEVSFDNGKTWTPAQRQAQPRQVEEHFSSYWTPIPSGTQQVLFRGQDWWGGPWTVRDSSVWAR